jgi:phosphoglucomutase
MTTSLFAGKLLPKDQLVDLTQLLDAYYKLIPDATAASQKVSFGTSGHRGSSLNSTFNEYHVLAITQAICDYRKEAHINGPLFLGIDTHALSAPAQETALSVLAANSVHTFIAENNDYTPTPVISHAILTANFGKNTAFADGIVITPSHNPPDNGGFKYNPPHGGPADSDVTNWIQNRANEYLSDITQVKRVDVNVAFDAPTTKCFDFVSHYVKDLGRVIDFDVIRESGLKIGVDPLGGAGVNFWIAIANYYKINLTVVNKTIDKQFGFMTADWDGKIRMDPSSQFAMQSLLALKDNYDIAFACDTDHDRHGIVTKAGGLMLPNHYLSVAIDYLYTSRSRWDKSVKIGKTLVSSALIDRVAKKLDRELYEVPVGFKWFAPGLFDGTLGFGGEESAGASFLDRQGNVWVTDKDGFIPALLAAEMTAASGKDPHTRLQELTAELGKSFEARIEAPLSATQKQALSKLSPDAISSTELLGEPITVIRDKAPGNNAGIGGIKVETASGWFAARPSGTEPIYKIYAESFVSEEHLQLLITEARKIVDKAIS